MPSAEDNQARAFAECAKVEEGLRLGLPASLVRGQQGRTATRWASETLGLDRLKFAERVGSPVQPGRWFHRFGIQPDWSMRPDSIPAQPTKAFVPLVPPLELEPEPSPFAVEHTPQIGTVGGPRWELTSLPDNTYRFGAFGDLHAASKYTRWDVRADLVERATEFRAQVIFDTGNWIDGEKSFNRYDLECAGLDAQCKLLAQRHPRSPVPIQAVTGADHEGWYVKSEGIDVGRYCESIMREHGHDWSDLGYMQADVVLRNANSGATSILRVMHPGGGTGYALSYRPQKIIEAMEGGEKPAVLCLGHYHKIDVGLVRNVWYVQTGCQQDQTPFMAQKAIEAHVGGFLIEMEQDPDTGAIISFTPQARRYFNQRYYFDKGMGNNRWNGSGRVTSAPRVANIVR